LIVTDHWPAALLGAAGHPAIHTPVLDQLCRNGVRFSNCYSETPVCLPARRTLMTGCTPKQHGDRTFQPYRPMEPHLPTMAQCFRDAGYQAYAVGKTHTYPQRDRIGFDDIQLDDEGRTYLGYRHPHPPLVPPQRFLDHYADIDIDMPYAGEWASGDLPYNAQGVQARNVYSEREVRWARRAFYALCTHIDQQIGSLIGTIREEGILDNTIIMFTSDHGDNLGNHGMWAKQNFYEGSANVPMIVVGEAGDERLAFGATDDRVTGLQDVMPTLLGLAGIQAPQHCDGRSMVTEPARDYMRKAAPSTLAPTAALA